jgi:hypothetical protein
MVSARAIRQKSVSTWHAKEEVQLRLRLDPRLAS